MKKHLLTTTAAVALTGIAAAPAAAQEWDVNVGGYFNMHTGFTSVGGTFDDTGAYGAGTDFDGVQLKGDAEISVVPSITLDNGLTFGANIQLETDDGSDMDEVYMYISGDNLGTIEIGNENSAGYKGMFVVPNPGGVPINSGSISGFVPFASSGAAGLFTGGGVAGSGAGGPAIVNSFAGAGMSPATEVGGAYGNNDIARINYFTPSFNGVTVGVSYAPGSGSGADGNTALVDRNAQNLSDILDLGVTFSQSYGNMDVNLAARYGMADWSPAIKAAGLATTGIATSDPTTWGVAGSVASGPFAIGAAYAENDNGFGGGVLDESGYTIGMTYDIAGPWTAGLEYKYGEGDHGTFGGVSNGKDELSAFKVAASRNMGPGVNWSIWGLHTNVDAADAATGGLLGGATGTDVSATTIGTTIGLSF